MRFVPHVYPNMGNTQYKYCGNPHKACGADVAHVDISHVTYNLRTPLSVVCADACNLSR